jgi:hypothetical protein
MTQRDVAHRLFDFLDQHAFAPVLNASAERYPEPRRAALLRSAQERVRRERERFERGASAGAIYRIYHEELAAPETVELHERLRQLDLPTLEDVRIDFEQMANDLGIGTAGAL